MNISSLEDILQIKDVDTMLSDEVFDYLITLDTPTLEKNVLKIKDYIKSNKKTLNCLKAFNALLKEKKEELKNKKNEYNTGTFTYDIQIPDTGKTLSFKMQNYYINEENNQILKKCSGNKNDTVICRSIILPYSIISDVQTDSKMIDLVYLDTDFNWKTTRENINTITNNSSLNTQIGKVFTGITSNNSKELIEFFQEIISTNPKMFMPKKSASHFGWLSESYEPNDIFVPYDGVCEFCEEGDDAKRIYNALTHPMGTFEKWQQITEKIRKNIPMRLTIDLSIATPILQILGLDSFTLLLYGSSELGKSKCQQAAMTVWGNPDGEVGLKFPMKATENYLGTLAGTLKNIPLCVDELKVYKGDLNALTYNHSLNKDKGRSMVSKKTGKIITQKAGTWRTPLIISGEYPIMSQTSDAGALNRLIEIEVKEKTMEDFHRDCPILFNNYGWAGEKVINYIRGISREQWQTKLWEIQENIVANVDTTEKQANLMAVILLGDMIARELFYKNEQPLSIEDYSDFLYSKEEISLGQRAYKQIISLISAHQNNFYIGYKSPTNPIETLYSSPDGKEFWGEINENQIKILNSQLNKLLKNEFDKECSPQQIIKEWKNLGFLQLTTAKNPKVIHQTTVQKRKGDYVWINIIGDYDDGIKKEAQIISIEQNKIKKQQEIERNTDFLNKLSGKDLEPGEWFQQVGVPFKET